MTCAMKNFIGGNAICISLLDAVAARHYLQISSIFCSATQDCFGSSCTVSIYMAQLIISSAKFTQLSTLLPHDFNQETSTKVNQVVQLLWYLCVFDTDKIFVTGLHLQVRIPQHCIWPTVFHNKNFNNVDFTMSKHSPSIHRYPPTLNLRWQFCHPIHCPGWAHPVHQGRCSQQILEKSPPPCMVSSGSKNLISSIHHTYCRKECIQHKYLTGDATALNISYTKVRINANIAFCSHRFTYSDIDATTTRQET